VRLLNVDLSTVTTAADLILGLGEPLEEIIHLDFQSSAAARKHADLPAYNALLFAHYLVPVHTILLLLRPEAAHSNVNGRIAYEPRPGRGSMEFTFEVVPLWRRPADELLAAELGGDPRYSLSDGSAETHLNTSGPCRRRPRLLASSWVPPVVGL
jgi:hypothetical protein